MKPTFNQLKAQAKKLGFEEWKKQGRTPEECWAVMNFLTGIGGIRIAEETERARKEERERIERAVKKLVPEQYLDIPNLQVELSEVLQILKEE